MGDRQKETQNYLGETYPLNQVAPDLHNTAPLNKIQNSIFRKK